MLLVVVVAGLALRGLLAPGLPISFDAHSHLAMSSMVAEGLAEGSLPSFSNDWYGGFRLLEFYSPLFHMGVGALGYLVGDVVLATKWVLYGGQILAALGFYALLLRVTGSRWMGVLAACLAVRSVELKVVIGVIGNQPTLFIYAAAPLWLACALGRGDDPRTLLRRAAAQSLLLAAMLAAHLSNTLMVLPSLVVFALVAIGQRAGSLGDAAPRLASLLLGGVLAFVLTAFETLPMLLDLDAVSLSLVAEISQGPSFDPEPVLILLGLEGYSYAMPFVRTPGWAWWVLCGLGVLASLHRSQRAFRPFVAALLCSLFASMALGERAVIGVVLFLLPLVVAPIALAAHFVADRTGPAARLVVPLAAALLVLILPSSGQLPDVPYAPEDALDVYAGLPDTPTQSRTFDVTPSSISLDGFYGPGAYSPRVSGRGIPFGAFPQGAPLGVNVTMSLWSEVVEAFRAPTVRLGEEVADLLYLAHVGFLVDRAWGARAARHLRRRKVDPNVARMVDDPAIGRRLDDRVFALRYASPAIFAPVVQPLPSGFRRGDGGRSSLIPRLSEAWRDDPVEKGSDSSLGLLHRTGSRRDGEALMPLVASLGLDRSAALADRFYVEDALPGATGGSAAGTRFEVRSHSEALSRVEIVAIASGPGYVRVSQSFDPALRVELDGQPVTAVADALGSGLIVAFPEGEHRIVVRAPTARLRDALLTMTGVSALALLAWLGSGGCFVPRQ